MPIDNLKDLQASPLGKIARSLVPVFDDVGKETYLGYLASGFTHTEALGLSSVDDATVKSWLSNDPEFARVNAELHSETRSQLAAEFTQAEYLRNFRLMLAKDHEVLTKHLEVLSDREFKYLIKARNHYTPQALVLFAQLMRGDTTPLQVNNFSQLVIAVNQSVRNQNALDRRVDERGNLVNTTQHELLDAHRLLEDLTRGENDAS